MTVTEIHTELAPPPDEPRNYTGPEVCALTGITYRQLDYWCRTGRLSETAHGSGSRRVFTDEDVLIARYAKALLDAGFQAPTALALASVLTKQPRVLLGDQYLRIQITTDDPTISEGEK